MIDPTKRYIVSEMDQSQISNLTTLLTPRLNKFIPNVPTPKQTAFLLLDCKEAFYGGAAGGGKSDALLMAALQYVDVPGYSAIIFRKTFAELELPEALMDRAAEWLAPFKKTKEVRWSDRKHSWTFPSGAKLTFGYMEGPKDKHRYQCFHPDTEILTNKGWKYVKDVEINELVATVVPDTRQMMYAPVNKTFKYLFEGTLHELNQRQGAAFCVTPNHKIFASTYKVNKVREFEAINLPYTARIPQTVMWEGENPSEKQITFSSNGNNGKSVTFPIKVWMDFLGWFISEGSISKCENHGYCICLSQKNKVGRDLIRKCLSKTNINYYEDKDCFRFQNKALFEWINENIGKGSNNKKIPRALLTLSTDYLQIMLDSLVEGDGTWRDKKHINGHFVTSSTQLKDDITELCIKCGYQVTSSLRQGNKVESPYGVKPRWHVSLFKKQTDTLIFQKLKQIPYIGNVYCIEVKPYHSVIIRYKNRVCWIGQSAAFHFVGYDELTAFEEDDYIYLFSRMRRLKKIQASGVPLRFRSASNPGNIGHMWVKKRFLEDGEAKGRVFIPAVMQDNEYLDLDSYIENMNELDPVTRAQLMEGNWEVTHGGKVLKSEWFPIIEEIPPGYKKRIRYWDLAATDPKSSTRTKYDPAFTSGCLMSEMNNNIFIEDIQRIQASSLKIEELLLRTAQLDGYKTDIWFEEEPGSHSKGYIQHLSDILRGFNVRSKKETENKITRALRTAGDAERGRIKILKAHWNKNFLEEAELFPDGKHKDQIDSFSGGYDKLKHYVSYNLTPTDVGVQGRSYWEM